MYIGFRGCCFVQMSQVSSLRQICEGLVVDVVANIVCRTEQLSLVTDPVLVKIVTNLNHHIIRVGGISGDWLYYVRLLKFMLML